MRITKYALILILLACRALAQESNHKFFDNTNVALFSAHAAVTGWDAWETQRGTHMKYCAALIQANDKIVGCGAYANYPEADPLARPFIRQGTPGTVTFFALEVAANVGVAYLMHRAGHHKLERVVSVVNIGISVHGAQSWIGTR